MAAFLYSQMPVDSTQTTKLRVTPNAPGHIKDPARQLQGTNHTGAIVPTKQGDQCLSSLESLLNNKHYANLKEYVFYSLAFLNDPRNCAMNSIQLLVYLSTSMYPEIRSLDILRVPQL